HRYKFYRRTDMILPGWEFESISPWNPKWERTIKVDTHVGSRHKDITQRLMGMTPQIAQVMTVGYNWDLCYLTQEFGPELTRSLVYNYFASKKDVKEPDRRLQTARFLHQAGWPEAAEAELTNLLKAESGDAKVAEEFHKVLKEQLVAKFIDEMDRAAQLGQY